MDHTRHADLFDASSLSVTLIGAGGIGAAAALALAKMGIAQLTIWDRDEVNEVNIATQFHRLSDIGRPKVAAARDMLLDFADGTEIAPVFARVEARDKLKDNIILSAVDSIQARKDIWQAVKNGRCNFYLDARMAAEEFHLNTVWMNGDTAWYEEMLANESDETAKEEPCTAKATIYTALMSAGHIGNAVKHIANHDVPPRRLIHNIRANLMMVIP